MRSIEKQLKILIYNYSPLWMSNKFDRRNLNHLEYFYYDYNRCDSSLKNYYKNNCSRDLDKIKKFICNNNITNDILESVCNELKDDFEYRCENRKKVTQVFNRDNRTEYNYGSGYGKNTIRYPRKTRSRRQWANFYRLFPMIAKIDNWDGKTSDKMKK